jgi:uncharacterized membrane protein (DUF485 family)
MHEQSTNWSKDNSTAIKIALGKWLFVIYSLFYFGFIMINVLSPDFMAIDVGSLNVAIVYGFGLIIFAMVLAVAYNHVCTVAEEALNEEDTQEVK